MSISDPREEITHSINIGQIYSDSRTDEKMLLVYLDSNIAVLRTPDDNHRLSQRRDFERNVGAGRFSLQDDQPEFGNTGRLSRVIERAEEYDSEGGRKGKHYAEAMRESVEILTDQGAEDAREPVDFEEVSGVGEATASALRAAGYRTRGDVRKAADSELLSVSGVGNANLENLREHV